MKKILFILIMAIIASCSPNLTELENKKEHTTIEALELVSDTLAVSEIKGVVHLIDLETNLVKYKFKQAGYDSRGKEYAVLHYTLTYFIVLLALIIGMGIGVKINE